MSVSWTVLGTTGTYPTAITFTADSMANIGSRIFVAAKVGQVDGPTDGVFTALSMDILAPKLVGMYAYMSEAEVRSALPLVFARHAVCCDMSDFVGSFKVPLSVPKLVPQSFLALCWFLRGSLLLVGSLEVPWTWLVP